MKESLTLVTFLLGKVVYALEAKEIREVVPLPEMTPIANAPVWVSGIFNLRGQIVTAIDLRLRLGLEPRPWDLKNVILVTPHEGKLYGFIVDQALTLMNLPDSEISPSPNHAELQPPTSENFILAIGKTMGALLPILDLKRILSSFEAVAMPREANGHAG